MAIILKTVKKEDNVTNAILFFARPAVCYLLNVSNAYYTGIMLQVANVNMVIWKISRNFVENAFLNVWNAFKI